MSAEVKKVHEQQEGPTKSPEHKEGPKSTKEAKLNVVQANKKLEAVVERDKKSGEKHKKHGEIGSKHKEKGGDKVSERSEKISEQAKKDLKVFREVGNITAVEMGEKINVRMAEISEKKGNVTEEDYQKARQEVLDSMNEGDLQEIMQSRIDKLNFHSKGKDGNELDKTLYETLKEKDSKLSKTLDNFKNQDLAKQALATYGPEKMKALNPIIEQLKKDGKEIPDNLDELNKLFINELAKEQAEQLKKEDPDKPLDEKVLKQAAQTVLNGNSGAVSDLASGGNTESGKNVNFEAGNAIANSAELKKAIDSLPEGSKARKALEISQKYLGYSEKDPKQRAELKAFLGFDPAKTPWCKGFINAVMKKAGIHLNSAGSLAARSGSQDGRKLKIPGEKPKPGDIVVVERKGKTTGGTPGGHIGIFIGMDSSGKPIIIGGNQGNKVSIKTERRPIISINRVVPEGDQDSKKSETTK